MNQILLLVLIAAALDASLVFAAIWAATHTAAAVALIMTSHLFYLVSCWLIHRNKSFDSRQLRTLVWISALVMRVSLAPFHPSLSEDVNRYRWEGWVQTQGGNPYLLRPEGDHIPAAGFRAGYGPLIELLERANFQVAAAVAGEERAQAFGMKLAPLLFEAATLWLVRAMPPGQLVFYAWSPVILVEFWWNGHNDSIAVFFVVLALRLANRERWAWALLALGGAISAKWWPAVLLPVFAWGRWGRAALAAIPTAVLGSYYWMGNWAEMVENARYMSGYLGGWCNNDGLFGAIYWLTGDPYRAKYLSFGLVAATALWIASRRGWTIEQRSLAVIVSLLVLSANVHPWYLTWFAPLLIWIAWPPLLLWGALMPVTYRAIVEWDLLRIWNGSTADRFLVWIPVLGWMGWRAATALIAGRPARGGVPAGFTVRRERSGPR